MKVSIVIPCYNEKDTIEKILEAVCNAPLKSREIIVVPSSATGPVNIDPPFK
jgi:glycosyltransferase involved in cell wall biosynthesis